MTTTTPTRTIEQEASVASHTRDIDTLARLAFHSAMRVKFLVAYNPHTPVEVLTIFATDKSPIIRRGVARNPNAPAELLTKLAKDKNFIVRKAVAQNRNTPTTSLLALKKDPEKEVAEVANYYYSRRPDAEKPKKEVIGSPPNKKPHHP